MVALPPPAQPTVDAIYAAYEAAQDDGWRPHLGASQIGNSCERALWYGFRWATRRRFNGRMNRLLETGNLAEPRFIANLRAAGVAVSEVDPATDNQWIVRDESGHFGGSLDGLALGIHEAPKTLHLLELKTSNAKGFDRIVREGVQKAKPLHYAQMQTYMHLRGLTRAFYLVVNKDTDELHSERINYNLEFGIRMVAKAHRVINAQRPPPRIRNDPSWWECKFCDHRAVCWEGALPERHCRSCLHSTPVAGGKWSCARWNQEMNAPAQVNGCASHLYVPEFVPGEQIDATDTSVTYRGKDGSIWIDGVTS